MKRRFIHLFAFIFSGISFVHLNSQIDLSYQQPPKAITNLIDAPLTPAVILSPDKTWMALFEQPTHPSIEELAEEELRLAGIRINPRNNGSSRSRHYNGFKLKALKERRDVSVEGLPENLKIENIRWSPDGSKIAFTNTTTTGLELWMVDVSEATARRLTDAILNDALGVNPYYWFSDSRQIIYKAIPDDRGPVPERLPTPRGPVIRENIGTMAAVRTYQDLLQDKYDELLFDYYTSTKLIILDMQTGAERTITAPSPILNFKPSPDGRHLLLTRIVKPYSYLVPYYRFPQIVEVLNTDGQKVSTLAEIPLAENIPKGFGAVRKGPRSFAWRSDAPATVYWVEAQDQGDPKVETEIRDKLYFSAAPFDHTPREAISFKLRFGGIEWGSENIAIVHEYWWPTRRRITSRWNPANPQGSKSVLFDRNTEDRYNDPGSFQKTFNQQGYGQLLIKSDNQTLFLTGTGASPLGNRPFVDEYDLSTGKTKRLWQSQAPYYEYPISMVEPKQGIVLTRRESKDEPPNYFFRNLENKQLLQLTFFEHPYDALRGVSRELIKYMRNDSVQLTGTLYLPAGYNREKDGPLPVLMWAYPREYKSAKTAGQVSGSPYQFVRLSYGSPIFWVTQGYAVFDNFAMPIIGEGDEEPNETFVEQLRQGAEAAINKLCDMGIADRDRIAVGGHSYGAFMTANLLAHTDLFAAGIARSGAYNRTLTPFGFQREERTFWEAPDVYFKMSPFMHAQKIKEPILLIHGEADNNSGTFPMQSQRFYTALKGHGATARLVMLPHESHGYRARESILHMLWEMNNWLEKYVKNKKVVKKTLKP